MDLIIKHLQRLPAPSPASTRHTPRHTQSELVTFLARTPRWTSAYRMVRTLYGCYNQPGCRETVFMTYSSTKRREDRLEVRLTPRAKSMLRRAASVERKTVSAFILDKGLAAADETLADRREFQTSAQQYEASVVTLHAHWITR